MRTNSSHATRIQLRPEPSGFTLVEMLLVLTILSLLAGIVVPRLIERAKKARIIATQTQIASLANTLNIFALDNGHFPAGRNGFTDLLEKPRDAQNWSGPYIDRLPKDAWDHDFEYVCPGKKHPHSIDIISAGPDGQFGTDDDIINP